MPRIPRKWSPYFHPQAVRRTSQLSYRPGQNGSGMVPMKRVPIMAYTQKATGVPLTGGQNQGIIPGFPSGSGSASAPAALTALVNVTVPATGQFTVNWTVTLAGTLSSADANNFVLLLNSSTVLAFSVNADTAGSYPQAPVTQVFHAGDVVTVANVANATAGSTYSAVITGSSGPLTLTAGPQGLGTVWYPAQVTLSTTTGSLDTSTALVYLGSQGVPITQVGNVFGGNGVVALAIPSMSPGQVLIVTWSNGHAGDTAAFNIVGTMDALTTG
jgi:hypothetical protein